MRPGPATLAPALAPRPAPGLMRWLAALALACAPHVPSVPLAALALLMPAAATHAAAPAANAGATQSASPAAGCAWPAWNAFRSTLLSADGRVIDASTPRQVTVSEGQSYALFFALVANDRASFDKVLTWTENNLAQGDLASHLPAWIWGRRDIGDDGKPVAASTASGTPAASHAGEAQWGVIDSNPASDADLWIAYTLLEAGRLWNERRYTALGTVMARNIVREETAVLPGLGRTVLPGPVGFTIGKDGWRLNPSYVPLQVMRRFMLALPQAGEWKALLASSARLVNETAPKGYSPDWVEYHAKGGFAPDAQTHAEGAYNAIRVYLWAGMLAGDDPLRASTLATFKPLADFVGAHGFAPERVDTTTGTPGPNEGNGGFSAAVAPYLATLGRSDLANAQAGRSRTLAQKSPPGYYSSVLMLFGLGYLDGLYHFDAQGRVAPAWTSACPTPR
ncbi:cellulose synthase complex periplasmic endoglucanase BcsZ [Paraburkholderia silvatlantica]|uniref:cellulase n=1 Tax=Paraburkholderia silvatlantica TaxID=321895 RepID=A0ABR6FZN7_9BURK|nr:cellulose synthase complex periplasmic endoglucanase BcsZ [Paraburkholderia silvatlantica]MBB2932905.1 endoglucanase [Paraburkholderia silvatlantica]PVY17896.1 endoglucanase [Paraburkholderia silvatlantica]PXW23815.1 endoglucanase [Paraburkholderia silvatlantica]